MISSVFVDRPRLAIVISIVISLAGLIALGAIPIAQFPDIVPPQVQVTANYPGSGAEVVEATVAQPIESQVIGVDNMLYMKSTSGNDGSYTLTISFKIGTDPTSIRQCANRVSLATPKRRRSDAQRRHCQEEILGVAAINLTRRRTARQNTTRCSHNYVSKSILDEIKQVNGVGDALFGSLEYSMRVWIESDRLTSLGIAPSDIINALQSQNIQAAVGRIGAQPMTDDQLFQLNIQTKGRLIDEEEFGNTVVRANPDGSFVRIRISAASSLAPECRCVRPLQSGRRRRHCHLSGARRERSCGRRRCRRGPGPAFEELS
jgi:multidrug efflux pump subunit AcrB